MNNRLYNQIDYKFELLRKTIHICSLSIPIIYYFLPKSMALLILSGVILVSVIIDIGRFASPAFGRIVYRFLGSIFREHELDTTKRQLSGATWLLFAAIICILIFPKGIAMVSLFFLIIGDTVAALIGRKWGKIPFLKKSLEGSGAFFVSTIFIALLTPKFTDTSLEIGLIVFSGLVASIAENYASGWLDDNIAIPLSSGTVLWLLYLWFFPNLDLVFKNVPQ